MSARESGAQCKKPGFRMRKTCDECPWRKDVPVGRFPPERYIKLQKTVRQGFGPLFACHKTYESRDETCVGFLLVEGDNNWTVRLAHAHERFQYDDLEATGPLYESFEQMARANGVAAKRRKGARSAGR